MKFWMQGKAERDPRAFGERFAWRMVMLFAGMALYLTFGSIIGGRPIAILATLIALPLSYGFRLRAAAEERRRGETMEDERDAWILAQGDRGFRIAVSCWYGVLTLALCFDTPRAALQTNDCALPSMVLLGLIVANIVGQLTVAVLYRRDRQ